MGVLADAAWSAYCSGREGFSEADIVESQLVTCRLWWAVIFRRRPGWGWHNGCILAVSVAPGQQNEHESNLI